MQKLEEGDLPLEQSLKLFEEWIRLSCICNTRLEESERKVEILLKDKQNKGFKTKGQRQRVSDPFVYLSTISLFILA